MLDRIDDELMKNGTLNSQIQLAVSDAIAIYQKQRFRFNETQSCYFMTNVGQQTYNAANTTFTDPSFPNITMSPQTFYSIEKLLITIPPAVFEMQRIQPAELLILTQTGTQMGQPYHWSYDNETISLYPVPSSGGPGQIQSFVFTQGNSYAPGVYTNTGLSGGSGTGATANLNVVAGSVIAVQIVNPGLRYQVGDILSCTTIGPGSGFALQVVSTFTGPTGPYKMTLLGHFAYPSPDFTTPTGLADTSNRWMLDGERLIRSRAKYNIAQHVSRNPSMAAAMSPSEPGQGQAPGATYEAYRELRVENTRITQRGVVRPMYF